MGSPPPIWRHPLPLAAPAVLNPPLPNSRAGSRGCTQPSHVGCPPPSPAPPIPRCVPGRNWPLPARTIPSPPCSSRDIVFAALAGPSPLLCSPLGSGNCSSSSGNPALIASGGAGRWGHSCETGITSGKGGKGHPQLWGRAGGSAQGQRLWGDSSHCLLPRGIWGGAMQCPTATWGEHWVNGGQQPPQPSQRDRQGKGLLGWNALHPTVSPLCPTKFPLDCPHVPIEAPPCPHCHHPAGMAALGRCSRAVASWLHPTPPSLLLSPHPLVPSPSSHPPAPLCWSHSWDWGREL